MVLYDFYAMSLQVPRTRVRFHPSSSDSQSRPKLPPPRQRRTVLDAVASLRLCVLSGLVQWDLPSSKGGIYISSYELESRSQRGINSSSVVRRPSCGRERTPHFCRQAAAIVRAWYLHHSAAVCATLKFTSVIYSEKSSHLHSVRELSLIHI